MKHELPKYNLERKKKVTARAALHTGICVYLLYLSWMILRDPTASGPVPFLASGLFALVSVVFGIYAWKRYHSGLKDAELTPEELEQERILAEQWEEDDFD